MLVEYSGQLNLLALVPFCRVQFSEFIQKNILLYQFRNGIPLSTSAAANFTCGELAHALRKVRSCLTSSFSFTSASKAECAWGVCGSFECFSLLRCGWVGEVRSWEFLCNAIWSLQKSWLQLIVIFQQNPYFVNMMIAGYDSEEGPSLYYLDYIATLHKVKTGALGYGKSPCFDCRSW